MIAFYLEAARMDAGRIIELRVYNGTPEGQKHPLGAITLTQAEWATLRPVIVAALRWAGYQRIPIALMDQTRNQPALRSVD